MWFFVQMENKRFAVHGNITYNKSRIGYFLMQLGSSQLSVCNFKDPNDLLSARPTLGVHMKFLHSFSQEGMWRSVIQY